MGWWKLTLVVVLVVAVTLQFAQGQTSIQFSFSTNLPTGDEAVAASLGGTQQIFLPVVVNIEPSTVLLQSNIVVGITVTSGTATSGTDFVLTRDGVTFDAGANDGNTISVHIKIWDDLIVEGTEGFTLTGSVVTTGTIGVFVGGPATISILDDDTQVTEITTLAFPPSVSPTRGVEQTSSLTSMIQLSVSPTRGVLPTFSVTMAVSPSMSTSGTVLQPSSSPVQAIPPSVSPTDAMQPSSSLTSPTGTVPLSSFPEQAIPQSVSPTQAVLPTSPLTMVPTETVQPFSSPTQAFPPSSSPTGPVQPSSSPIPSSVSPTEAVQPSSSLAMSISPTEMFTVQLSSSPMQAIPPSVSPTQAVLVSSSPAQEIPAVEPSSSLTTAVPPSVLPTRAVQPSFSPVLVITSSPQPTQQPLQPISIFTMRAVQQTLTPTSPTETSLSTEPPQTTGQLSGGEIAAIVIVLVIVTKAIFLVVCAIGVFYIQRKRQRYILKSSIHQDHGTSVTDTSAFVRPPKSTDEEHLAAIQMEAKAETVPVFSLVAINPAALEDDDERASLWMNNAGGEGVEQESKTEKQQIDDSIRTHIWVATPCKST